MEFNILARMIFAGILALATSCTGLNQANRQNSLSASPEAKIMNDPGTLIANENGTFNVPSNSVVAFGAGTSFIQMTIGGSGTCSNSFFGSDPDYGVVKACYLVGSSGNGSGPGTLIANENQSFTVGSNTLVYYGAGTNFISMTLSGSGTCSNTFFGSDPDYGVVKACYLSASVTATPTPTPSPTPNAGLPGTLIASENQTFSVPANTLVYFGAGSNFISMTISGSGTCSNTFFGSDPDYGVVKACYAGSSGAATPTPTPAPTPTPTPTPTINNGSLVTPTASADPLSPKIFNNSSGVQAGNVISIQGANFDSTSQVFLAGSSISAATQLSIVDQVGTTQISALVPSSASGGLIAWVSNSHGASKAFALNAAVPWHLDALTIVPGGAFRILGRNLIHSGLTPVVTVSGQTASINLSSSNANMLVLTAPSGIGATSAAVITVDNGNGTGPVTVDRTISVVAGSGDPLSLGVGWASGFTFTNNVINVSTACNGSQDDSSNIQNAINSVPASGGVVQIPAGNCILSNNLSLKSNVVLKGAGKDVTILHYYSNYPIWAQGFDLVGIENLTLVNANSTVEGMLWKNNTRSFFQNVKINEGVSHQMYLTTNQNMVVNQTDFIQTGSVNEQNPFLFSYSSGLVFTNNTSVSIDGSPTFNGVHDSLFMNNHITRNAANQYESTIIATHMFVVGLSYRITIMGNTFDVINGPITNINRNDGETILSEGAAGGENSSIGTVASATSTSLTDPNNTINLNPYGSGQAENTAIIIVAGTGAGQSRDIVSSSGSTFTVDHAWDVIPDATSKYTEFVWGLEKTLIVANQLIGNPRGIWLYQSGFREVDVTNNVITNGGGIFMRSWENVSTAQFLPIYNVRVSGNTVSNNDGIWMSYIDNTFINKDSSAYGFATIGVEIRNNTITANSQNVYSSSEDAIVEEGFTNLMRNQSGASSFVNSPMVVGTILQSNTCNNCSTDFLIGTGDYGSVIYGNLPASSTSGFLADWQTLANGMGGSTATLIH